MSLSGLPHHQLPTTNMLTPRDGLLVVATAAAVLAYQNAWKYYAQWQGRRTRVMHPLIPAQIDAESDGAMDNCDDGVPRRIRKAETVLARRTARIALVLEASCDMFNQQAVLRTAECMGIQHIWIVEPAFYKQDNAKRRIAREATEWLTIRRFQTTEECIKDILAHGYEIWATDLSQEASSLEAPGVQLPDRVAIVMGREADGVSETMLAAATKRVYLPIHGFADSLNLNVATGMVLLQLFHLCPEARGAMAEEERTQLRDVWYRRVAKRGDDVETLLASPPAPYGDLRRPDDHRGAWMGSKVRRKIAKKEHEIKVAAGVAGVQA